ncbi:hypothetical protein TWF506_002497 [Arthrobotrys conoides]|uniref:F-box domain-containing protein n=1 Tax=Arthrobotrys conoides TaxID=74498 RepID=A0AAN8RRI2_9PEZI
MARSGLRSSKYKELSMWDKLHSLPIDIQIEILSYLDLECQIAAATSCPSWATLLLSFFSLQIPRRFPEIHEATGFRNISALLDSGRENRYIKINCEYGTIYAYFFIESRSRGRGVKFDDKGYLNLPSIARENDLSNCPLIYDMIFPAREFIIKNPPKTTMTASGKINFNKPINRVSRKPLVAFFTLLDMQLPVPKEKSQYAHRLWDPRVVGWKEKRFKFNLYKKATVVDLAQVGLDMLWHENWRGCLPRKDGVYQLLVYL